MYVCEWVGVMKPKTSMRKRKMGQKKTRGREKWRGGGVGEQKERTGIFSVSLTHVSVRDHFTINRV